MKLRKFNQNCLEKKGWSYFRLGFYHDCWQSDFQALLRQVADEDGEVGADAGAEGKEEDDEDDDGDVEEGAATGREVGQGDDGVVGFRSIHFTICVVPQQGAWDRWEEVVVGCHGCRAGH